MRIDQEISSYSQTDYGNGHNHHITKCLHEEGEGKKAANAGLAVEKEQKAGQIIQGVRWDVQPAVSQRQTVKKPAGRSGTAGLLRDFWNDLGEEKDSSAKGKESIFAVIGSALTTVKDHFAAFFSDNTILKERFRVNLTAALRRFGKEKDTFSTLTKDAGGFAGHGNMARSFGEEGKKQEEEFGSVKGTLAKRPDSHLLDSYNKKGAYCTLNENLKK